MALLARPTVARDLKSHALHDLGRLCLGDWKRPYFGCVPYLEALCSLASIDDMYGADSARNIVVGFLANAASWKGDTARAVKAELKRRLGR